MSFKDYRTRRVFGSLDGIRAGSILAVIWHHSTPQGSFSLPMFDRGFLGVDMFFVLSGYLIVTLLLREHERNGKISLRNFYARRTLRIFPVYYAVLGSLSLLYLWKPESGSAATFFAELPYYATYTSNWVSVSVLALTWSLATEEQFYLFWPPIERYLRPVVIPILLVVIAINQLLNFGVLDPFMPGHFDGSHGGLEILEVTFTPICLGVLLAHSLHNPRGYTRLARWAGKRYHSLVGAIIILIACNLPNADISGWNRLLIHLGMAYFLVCVVIREDHLLQRALSFRPIKRLGAISYGMYLYHIFAVIAASQILGYSPSINSPVINFLLTTLLTVIVSELSFRLFELPIMRWKKRFSG
jgi:peptidoglycan/LPS O-acetylase OafA/YrhL